MVEARLAKGEKEETRQMLQNINGSLGSTVSEKTLNGVFEALWPKLEHELSTMPKPATAAPPKRSLEDMVAEILELSRAGAKVRNETDLEAAFRRQLGAFYGEDKPTGNLKDFLLWTKPDLISRDDKKGELRFYQMKERRKEPESKDTAEDTGKRKK
jgi:PD-(D/E)XK nuclease superfamily